jgi:hypothetical protein
MADCQIRRHHTVARPCSPCSVATIPVAMCTGDRDASSVTVGIQLPAYPGGPRRRRSASQRVARVAKHSVDDIYLGLLLPSVAIFGN